MQTCVSCGAEYDDDTVRKEFLAPLSRVAETLNEYDESYIDVVGHADSIGDASYNERLSERRARAVSDALVYDGATLKAERFIKLLGNSSAVAALRDRTASLAAVEAAAP